LKINLTEILLETGSSLEFNKDLYLKDFVWQNENVSFKGPLAISGSIQNLGHVLSLKGSVRSTLILTCRLCLEDYEYELKLDFEARLKKDSNQDDPDYFTYTGYEIDLTDIIMEYIILELPSTRQCSDKCRGLCSSCGINKNIHTCDCINHIGEDTEPELDERFKALKDYLSAQNKEV